MSALLVINPAFATIDPKKFLGGNLLNDVNGKKRKVVRVWSDNWSISNGRGGWFPSGAHGGAISYRNALRKHVGTPENPSVTLTHSRGGDIAMKTLREWAEWLIDEDVDPAGHELYICGCPGQKFTGASFLRPTVDRPVYPGNQPHNWFCPTPPQWHGGSGFGFGLPDPMIWAPQIECIVQEFDGWADCPVNENIPEIAAFFKAGQLFTKSRTGKTSPHNSTNVGNYATELNYPTNVKYVDPAQPNVTYTWHRTYPFPSLATVKESPNWIRNEYKRQYPAILAGYSNRPVSLPMLEG